MILLIITNLFGIAILLFNLSTCYKLSTSNIANKTIRNLIVILVNFPTLIYGDVEGFDFNFFQLQVFGYGNDLGELGFKLFFSLQPPVENSHYVFMSIPIGAMFVHYKFENWLRDKEYADEGI